MPTLHPRQFGTYSGSDYSGDQDDSYNWWWSSEGMAARYAIIAVLFGSVLVFLLLSYFHARRRLKAGLPPLRYHAWMVARRHRSHAHVYHGNGWSQPHHGRPYYRPHPTYTTPDGYVAGGSGAEHGPDSQSFAMHGMPAAPPAYGQWEDSGRVAGGPDAPPPSYQPPVGGTKVAGDQVYVREAAGDGSEGAAGPAAPPPAGGAGRP